MSPEMRKVRQVFDEASEIANPAERQAFVAQACAGDDALRGEVEELLGAHDSADRVFDRLVPATRPASATDATTAGERIGSYKLLQKIGEGGCGVVYMADQEHPVRRRVALKVIKLGMDTARVIARFEAERQALALMDHPNIARVLDAGATETGRPFFVMELVRGAKITEFCDQQNLSTSERLELFIRVCQAVQHAHQKGIIHRDLKPSNILVTLQDGVTPVPKIIDFGIAKATTDLRLTDKTLFTQFELLIGTPAYMSPEQAELNTADIDTRSDIYSLGVLLYELLTGFTPFDSDSLLKSGLDAMRRTLRETEPARPSTKLKTLTAADLTDVARRRRAEPVRLVSLLSGDLDWIVLKALEKDRRRRYETANALAMEVQRHLDHEPVAARPPSALYLFQKIVRRHQATFVSVLVVGVLLVVSTIVSLGLAVRATQAEREQRHLRGVAEFAEAKAELRTEENRERLVRMHVAAGNVLSTEGDAFAALPRYVEALHLDAGHPDREEMHRLRIAASMRSAPALEQVWFHDGFVNSAEFSADGERVISASLDQTARVWDVRTGQPVLAPIRHDAGVAVAYFALHGRRLVTVDVMGWLRVWDAANGRPVGSAVETPIRDHRGIGFSPDGEWLAVPTAAGVALLNLERGLMELPVLATGQPALRAMYSADGRRIVVETSTTCVVFDTQVPQAAALVLPFEESVRFADLHPTKPMLAVASGFYALHFLNLDTGKPVWVPWTANPPLLPRAHFWDCRFSPDGHWLATGTWGGAVRVLDVATGRIGGEPMTHRAGIARTSFSPDSRWLATASWDNTARVWDPRSGQPVSPSLRHGGFVRVANFSPDGRRLLTGGQDRTVRLWSMATNRMLEMELTTPWPSTFQKLRLDSSQTRIVSCGGSRMVNLWDVVKGKWLCSFAHPDEAWDAEFSPDGTRILTGADDNVVRVWSVASHEKPLMEIRVRGGVNTVRWSPDGSSFIAALRSGDLGIWRAEDGQPFGQVIRHGPGVNHCEFSPDSQRIATCGLDGTARLWNARTGEPVGAPMVHDCEVVWVAFSPDSRRLATAACDEGSNARSAQIWDVATGQRVGEPLSHQDGVIQVRFSPDGRLVCTASEDGTAGIWDAVSGKRLTAPLRHHDLVRNIRFSPNGKLILTSCSDGTARVWDSRTGEAITPPLWHEGAVRSGAWMADSRKVFTTAEDGWVRLWDVSPMLEPLSELRAQAEFLSAQRVDAELGTVPLTPEESKSRWNSFRRSSSEAEPGTPPASDGTRSRSR